jgi:hypothetical protein
MLLKNQLVLAKLVDSESVDKSFKAGVGGTVYVKRPPEFVIRTGATASVQDVVEGEVAVSIDKQRGVDVQFTSQEDTLNVDALLKSKVLSGAMATIATEIDMNIASRINEFNNWVGTPANTLSSIAGFLAGDTRLNELGIPVEGRNAVLNPADANGLIGMFANNAAQIGGVAGSALSRSKIPMIGMTDSYMTQTLAGITTGTRTTAAVDGAAQNVTYANCRTTYTQTLNIDGVGNATTVVAGEVFVIAGVNAVNPRTKVSTGQPMQFTVITGGTSVASGTATAQDLALTISPPIITSGAFQNVSAAPADDAVITWLGSASTTYRPNAIFHKSAIKLVSAKLTMPYTGEADYATDPDTGLTVRYWRYSDGANDTHNHRFDVFFGTVNADRRLGTRLSGAA